MRIDLHTHSSVSDGTETPAALLATAREAGLDAVALTDHDTTDGWAAAAAARPPPPPHPRRLGRGPRRPPARDGRRPRDGAVLPLVPRERPADQRPPARL